LYPLSVSFLSAGLLAGIGCAGAPLYGAATDPAAPAAAPAAATMTAPDAAFTKNIHPLLEKYCFECHGNGKQKGDIDLAAFTDIASVKKGSKTWESVRDMVHTQQMPPAEAKLTPTDEERDQLVAWIEQTIYNYDPSRPDPGRVTIHRLNRTEYNNTIRDLVGLDFQPAQDFPADNSGYGFDNISDVLSLPPVLMEKYLAAATDVLDQAIPTEAPPTKVRHFQANLMEMGFNADGDRGDGWMPLTALEEDAVGVTIPVRGGDYIIRVQAFNGARGGNAPLTLTCMLDDSIVYTWEVKAVEAEPGVYEARIGVPPGKHRFAVANHRIRGDQHENHVENGRVGDKQAGTIWVKWVELEGPLQNAVTRVPADKLAVSGDGKLLATGSREFDHNGDVSMKFTVAKEGTYRLRAEAYAGQAYSPANFEYAKMKFGVTGAEGTTFDVMAPATRIPLPADRIFSIVLFNAQPHIYEYEVKLTPGEKTFSAGFINEFADPNNEDPNLRQRTLYIDHLEVSALDQPPIIPPMPAPIKQIFAASANAPTKEERARAILTQFATHAWRRPVEATEITDLMSLYAMADKDGQSFEASVKLPLKAILISPDFLFRGEVQPDPNNPASVHPVSEFALASRLSYFLWSSMPDDELFTLAAKGELRKNLDTQVRRMMADPKANALAENFAGQWLELRNLQFVSPASPVDLAAAAAVDAAAAADAAAADQVNNPAPADAAKPAIDAVPVVAAVVPPTAAAEPVAVPGATPRPPRAGGPALSVAALASPAQKFDNGLRRAMETETEMFFTAIMRDDRSVLDFLNGNYTYINGRLAQHYGIPGVEGDEFRKVSLDGTPRRGILTQASVLSITSNPTRTSPVKRGKWVLENILGTPPPPPPPDVPELKNDGQPVLGSLRHQMEEHRDNPVCASCHSRMDPIGFGLENFDIIGVWREKDGNFPIESAGQLVTGEKFNNAAELADILAKTKRDLFLRCLSEKMLTYALGRGLEYYDRPTVDKMVEDLKKNDFKFSTLIYGVVHSTPFQMQRGEGERMAAQ